MDFAVILSATKPSQPNDQQTPHRPSGQLEQLHNRHRQTLNSLPRPQPLDVTSCKWSGIAHQSTAPAETSHCSGHHKCSQGHKVSDKSPRLISSQILSGTSGLDTPRASSLAANGRKPLQLPALLQPAVTMQQQHAGSVSMKPCTVFKVSMCSTKDDLAGVQACII
jgi:hypothetical protein